MQFKRSKVSLLIKARPRMLNLKNYFKGSVSCPWCDLEIDDKNHVFTTTTKDKKKELNWECTISCQSYRFSYGTIDATEFKKDTFISNFTCICEAEIDLSTNKIVFSFNFSNWNDSPTNSFIKMTYRELDKLMLNPNLSIMRIMNFVS